MIQLSSEFYKWQVNKTIRQIDSLIEKLEYYFSKCEKGRLKVRRLGREWCKEHKHKIEECKNNYSTIKEKIENVDGLSSRSKGHSSSVQGKQRNSDK